VLNLHWFSVLNQPVLLKVAGIRFVQKLLPALNDDVPFCTCFDTADLLVFNLSHGCQWGF